MSFVNVRPMLSYAIQNETNSDFPKGNRKIEFQNRALKVVMVSTSYPEGLTDWQGVFIRNMTGAIASHREVELNLWAPPGHMEESVQSSSTADDSVFLKTLSRKGGIVHLLRTKKPLGLLFTGRLLLALFRAYRRSSFADLFHVNWLQNAIPLWGTRKPLLVTVLGTDMQLLNVPGMTKMLCAIFRSRPTLIAPNAEWMVSDLKKRFGRYAEIRPIPFGIDNKWFQIVRKVDFSKPLKWIVVSRITRQKMGDLLRWGEKVFSGNNELHLLGPMQEQIFLPAWIHYHGATHPEDLRRKWFPEAAGLVTLSRHSEGRPQVILEAMASGLPTIASNLKAHRDVIQNAKTGRLVANQEELVSAIVELSKESDNSRLGLTAREWVSDAIGTWNKSASRYVSAYQDLVRRSHQ